MKVSRMRFVMVFLIVAFTFQFISNSLLGDEIRLFPGNGAWFPGAESPIGWKSTLATILYPIKFVLIGPFLSLFKDPDAPPPVFVIAFGFYWSIIAFVLYYLFSKIIVHKK